MVGMYTTGLMTYVVVNNDYSRFELDNMQRWLTWEELDLSNFILTQIAQSPRAPSIAGAITQADTLAGTALAAYKAYDYENAQKYARAAYDGLVAAAGSINVPLSPAAYQAIRRNPADFNQAMRDFIASQIGDNHDQMTGTFKSTMPVLVQPTTPLAVKLTHPNSTLLK